MTTKGWIRVLMDYEWVRLPLVARYLSNKLTLTLVDGHYLTAWPNITAVPPLAILLGLLFGWQYWGFTTVFSESMLVMMLAAVLGILSGNLGALFVIGFMVGDFFLSDTPWSPFLRIRVPALIEYGLLGLLTTTIPVLTKTLLAQLTPPDALPRSFRFGIAVAGHVALTCALVNLWAQIVPILIRPAFTWMGYSPTVSAMAPLQQHGMLLVMVAGLASLGRMALQGVTAFRPAYSAWLDRLEEQYASAEPVKPLMERLPVLVRVLGRTIWSVLLLAGMLQFWLDAFLLAGLVFVLHAAHERLIPVPLGPWPKFVEKVPLLFRFIVGFVIVYYVSHAVMAQQFRATNTFRPVVVLVGLALLVFFLLAPGVPKRQPSGNGEETA